MATALAGTAAQVQRCGCHIPPPCWEPKRAGTCHLTLTPGGAGTVRIHVHNCEWARRVVRVTATGQLAAWVTLSPTTLLVEPQETATMIATVHVPDHVKPGARISGLLIVRGCLNHVIRVEITVAECAGCAFCDVNVQDCQDHIHHWYDHFYCPRPCHNVRVTGQIDHHLPVVT
jgi:hypothetical protein